MPLTFAASVPEAISVQATSAVLGASAVEASTVKKELPTPQQDFDEAMKLYERGVTGDMGAMLDATALFRRAAFRGHATAQARYGLTFERGQALDTALFFYRMAAEQGDAEGLFGYGMMFINGEGIPQDLVEGRKWVKLAAEQGHKPAIAVMVQAYLRRELSADELAQKKPKLVQEYIRIGLGLDEAARQSPEALAWIQKAADYDNPVALDALAAAYRTGQYGLAVDPKQADILTAKADKIRGIVPKEVRKKSALFRLLRGDPEKKK
ncbi:MAG: tetratricopeptide repeat protein [Gallionellaceae bacterium]|nr:tetratricopeptide repeat protein [Gallionellaceae bacterium]